MNRLKVAVLLLCTWFMSSCAINQKAQVEVLSKFNYDVESVDQIRLAGRDIDSYQSGGSASLASLPGIAMALLRQDLPLEARVNLKITNPTSTVTKINEFKYIIEMAGKPLFEGAVAENINLSNGQSMVVPLTFSANIFGVAKEQGFDKVLNDIFTRKSNGFFALKIKPSVKIGGKNFFYPGYITVDKDFGKSVSKAVEKGLGQL